MSEEETVGRKISFKCCVPHRISKCSDDDLRVSLVTLKNALANVTVCVGRIERELKKRGVPTSMFKAHRGQVSPEIEKLVESMDVLTEEFVS